MSSESVNGKMVAGALWWKMLERFTSQGLNLVIQIVLARLLLPEDFGQLAIISAIIVYCTVFVQGGLATAIIQKGDLKDLDVSTLLIISLGIASLLYIILFFLAPVISDYYSLPSLIWPLRIQSLALFLGAINSVQVALFSRAMDFKSIFFRSILSVPISGAIGICLAFWGAGIWALISQSLSSILITIIYMSFFPITHVKIGFSWESAKEMYSFSGKILFSGLISTFGDSFRTMLIGKKYNSSSLAYYDKGYSYSSLITQIVTLSMSSVMLPAFSRIQTDNSEILRMARRTVSLVAFIMIPALVMVIGMAEPLVILVLSEKWAPCVSFLMIFCLLRIPGCITNIDKQVYLACGNSTIGLYYETIMLIVNILVLLYTSTISIMAIAIGATIVEFIGNFILMVVSHYYYGYHLKDRLKDIWKPVFNSSLMLAILLFVGNLEIGYWSKLLLQIPLCFIVYYLGVKLTRDNNLLYLKSLVRSKINKN